MFGFKKKASESAVVEEKKKNAVMEVYGELTLRNSVKKLYSSTAEGADVLKSSAGAVVQGFSQPRIERQESFDDACNRLGVTEDDIPLIHNQLLLQAYVSFSIGVVAVIFVILAFAAGSMLLAKLVAVGAALASFVNAIQASLQCYRVRTRSLVEFGEWCSSSENWFPRKIGTNSAIVPGDARLDKKFRVRCAERAKKYYFIGIVSIVISLPGYYVGELLVEKIHYTTVFLGMFFLVLGVNSSVKAMQCAQAQEVDFVSWLSSPEFWIPDVVDASNSVMKKAE